MSLLDFNTSIDQAINSFKFDPAMSRLSMCADKLMEGRIATKSTPNSQVQTHTWSTTSSVAQQRFHILFQYCLDRSRQFYLIDPSMSLLSRHYQPSSNQKVSYKSSSTITIAHIASPIFLYLCHPTLADTLKQALNPPRHG